ncbi:MAG: right-handed parallel beta-helix repeat-containing protein [Bacteroidales bacterium]|nr:right-handed parallel beta-helix repeat-containing protein [Bacteroidales bacterium]
MKRMITYQKRTISMFLNSVKALIIGMIFISVPFSVGATDYYVSLTGNNGNLGTTPESAWRTFTYAATRAQAGDHVYIKGGNYGDEHVIVSYAGTSSNPIVFEGYEGTPIFDGSDYTGYAIRIISKPYVTLKNVRVTKYRYGIWVDVNSHYAIVDSCVADSCCNTDYVTKGYDGYGILVQSSNYCKLINCSTTDNGGDNIFLSKANYCTLENCSVYSKQTVSNQWITDYYVVLAWSSYNTIRNCYAEDINGSYKGNHGFIIKDGGSGTQHSTGNLFVNCTAKKFEEGFVCAHGAYQNMIDSCYADNTGKHSSFNFCFQNREGAHDNTFSNCTAVGSIGVTSVYSGTESSGSSTQNNTLFVNCSFKGINSTTIGAYLRNATNTTFKNCTYVNIPNLFRFSKSSSGSDRNSGTVLRNCILSGVAAQYDNSSLAAPFGYNTTETGYSDMAEVTTTYTDFWNGFSALSGTGNISADPLFADIDHSDYHLKSEYGRWDGTTWVTTDGVTSPCIDAGDPQDTYAKELSPNGFRINMGAYGNTAEASKSPTTGLKEVKSDWFTYYKKGNELIICLSELDMMSNPVSVSLTTLDGRTTKQIFNHVNPIVIDFSNYPKGFLIGTVSTSGKTKSFKWLND